MDTALLGLVVGGLFVAWLTGYFTGLTFKFVRSFIEKAAR